MSPQDCWQVETRLSMELVQTLSQCESGERETTSDCSYASWLKGKVLQYSYAVRPPSKILDPPL